ncbi:MAG: peptidylprolyl isomerase [Ndongobacter sp.]|nr:peptidylprolyl isomerase [Ndongobacter sp.]
MKKRGMAGALSLMLLLAGCGAGEKTAQGTYATVNGVEITNADYEKNLDLYTKMLIARYQVKSTVENLLIHDAVVRQELEKNKIEVTQDRLDADVQEAIKNLGGDAAFQQLLKDLDITEAQYRESLRHETNYKVLLDWYIEQHPASDTEMKDFYEKNKDALEKVTVSHILVASEEEAQKVKERLEAGEKFEDLAKELSTDPGSAANGGSMQETSPSTYVSEFAQALTKLEVGQISDPVKTEFGYHIIRLDGRKASYEDFRDEISKQLATSGFNAYLNELMTGAAVEKPGEEVKVEEQSSAPAADSTSQSSEAESSTNK